MEREARMTLQRLYEIAADNAQARNVTKDWDVYWWAMDRIHAWDDWINR